MATSGDTPGPTSSDQAPPTFKTRLSPHSHMHDDDLTDYDIDSDLKLQHHHHPIVPKSKSNEPPKQEDAPGLTNNLQWQHQQHGVTLNEDGGVSQDDLDETLTGPSLLADVDFNDEEEWHSFSHGSPVARPADSGPFDGCSETPNGSMLSVEVGASWSPPVKREQLNEQGLPLFQSPLPAATLSNALLKSAVVVPSVMRQPSTRHEPSTANHQHFGKTIAPISAPTTANSKPSASSSTSPGSTNSQKLGHAHIQQLPPPSALVAKLFPALRKEKRPLELSVDSGKAKSGQLASPHGEEVPSPTSSAGGDSGKGSLGTGSTATSLMNEELRTKLCLLETEIERFKSENTALEKLRREKEEVSEITLHQMYLYILHVFFLHVACLYMYLLHVHICEIAF